MEKIDNIDLNDGTYTRGDKIYNIPEDIIDDCFACGDDIDAVIQILCDVFEDDIEHLKKAGMMVCIDENNIITRNDKVVEIPQHIIDECGGDMQKVYEMVVAGKL